MGGLHKYFYYVKKDRGISLLCVIKKTLPVAVWALGGCSHTIHLEVNHNGKSIVDENMCRQGDRLLVHAPNNGLQSWDIKSNVIELKSIAKGGNAARVAIGAGCVLGGITVAIMAAVSSEESLSEEDGETATYVGCFLGSVAFLPIAGIAAIVENASEPEAKKALAEEVELCSDKLLYKFLDNNQIHLSQEDSFSKGFYPLIEYIKSKKNNGKYQIDLFTDEEEGHPREDLFWSLREQSVNHISVRVYNSAKSPYRSSKSGDFLSIKYIPNQTKYAPSLLQINSKEEEPRYLHRL